MREDGDYNGEKYDIVITEIKRNIEIIDAVKKNKPKHQVVFFYNVSRDDFIEQMYAESIETLISRSFKIKDLLNVTRTVAVDNLSYRALGLDLHLSEENRHSDIRRIYQP